LMGMAIALWFWGTDMTLKTPRCDYSVRFRAKKHCGIKFLQLYMRFLSDKSVGFSSSPFKFES
jgi:hypothetical protein